MKGLKKLTLLMVVLIMMLSTVVNAAELIITTKPAKSEMNVGDSTTVTVSWTEEMQAADFVLNYDSTKLEFVSTTIGKDYYMNSKGKVKVMWYSAGVEAEEKKEISFTFKGIAEGKAEISVTVEGGFATGDLQTPEGYNTENADTTITLIGATTPPEEDDYNDNEGTPEEDKDDNKEDDKKEDNGGVTDKEDNKDKNEGTKPGTTDNKNKNNVSTNPTAKPTTLPKAGKAQMFIVFAVVIGMIVFSSYQLKKYKGI